LINTRFATTQWSLVLAARKKATPQAEEALAELCTAYWFPIYAFVRRQVPSAAEAEDLTQGFFARLLEKDYLKDVDREKGRFRSFLLVTCRHYIANERDHARAIKRGGGRPLLSIDVESAEDRYVFEPSHSLTPERIYERQWALTLLARVLARLRNEFVDDGRASTFEALKAFLTGEGGSSRYRALAVDMATTEGAVKVAVHRLRRRYRELIRAEIATTVDGEKAVDDEVRHLMTALSSDRP
jgi:DNA-directed RNA polymerase specialized sigma24 family protein